VYRTLIPVFEELHGKRIVVRPYQESDAHAFFEAIAESREHLRTWLPFAEALLTLEDCRDWIIRQMANWLLREELVFGVWEGTTSRYLGGGGLYPRNWEIGYFEIGYWLRACATGNGYMTEAVQLLTDYAFTKLMANRVEIRCDERNIRSVAVAQRLGFVLEAQLRNDLPALDGMFRTTLVFALIPNDLQSVKKEPPPDFHSS